VKITGDENGIVLGYYLFQSINTCFKVFRKYPFMEEMNSIITL